MSKFLVVACDDDKNVQAIVQFLGWELRKADYHFNIKTGTDQYYVMEEVASDSTACTVIDTRTPEKEDEE